MAVKFELKFTGIKEVKAFFDKAPVLVRHVVAKEAYQLAEEIMTESKTIYVPVDTGTLRSTGVVLLPVEEAMFIKVVLGYGGPAAPYAAAVHELNKHYNNGKQWKYLETPFKEKAVQLPDRIREALKKLTI